MNTCDQKFKKRQTVQTQPLVEYTELSGIELIYPSNLVIGDSTDDYLKPLNEIVLITDKNNGLVAIVEDQYDVTNIPILNDQAENNNKPRKMDTLMQVYVASLTVVGLFIIFRLITKTK